MEKWTADWERISQLAEESEEYAYQTGLVESDLTFSGVTSIEDELQDELKENLTMLIDAGIRVWMLTGDKTETAFNIAKSCGLTNADMHKFLLTNDALME